MLRAARAEQGDALAGIAYSYASLRKAVFWVTHSYGSPVASSAQADQT